MSYKAAAFNNIYTAEHNISEIYIFRNIRKKSTHSYRLCFVFTYLTYSQQSTNSSWDNKFAFTLLQKFLEHIPQMSFHS